MILVYSDDSGINYKLKDGFFLDGPFILRSGMCLSDNKYFHLERLFIDLIGNYFNIHDWFRQEVHGTSIWNREGYFSSFKEERIREFLEELFQLIAKLNIPFVFGMNKKTMGATREQMRIEHARAIASFLSTLEHKLAEKNETGVIIADEVSRERTKKNTDKKNDRNYQTLLDILVNERVMWRLNSDINIEPIVKLRYKFETNSCFLLDQVHYVDSRSSIFIQLLDIITYCFNRAATYQYLVRNPTIKTADKNKVPISRDTFSFFSEMLVTIGNFDTTINDITFFSGRDFRFQTASEFLAASMMQALDKSVA